MVREDDDPEDATHMMMIQHLEDGSTDTRRPATIEEAQRLVELSGPCRFKPGDVVEWNPDLFLANYTLSCCGVARAVTQALDPPIHRAEDSNGSELAQRNDMAIAFLRTDEGVTTMLEYTYDSRRFRLVAPQRKARHVSRT